MCESESERRAEQAVEKLEKEPSYMHASWEKFSVKPTGIGAKYLWLKYTLLKEDVPDDVMKRMIGLIKDDIQLYEDQGHKPYSALGKKEVEEPIYMLLDLAKNNPDNFWEILQTPSNKLKVCQFNADLLTKARIEFPLKSKLKPRELYTFFGKQLGMKEEENGDDSVVDIGERMRSRYRTYKKNKKSEKLLFD